jgi:hypothetical protein
MGPGVLQREGSGQEGLPLGGPFQAPELPGEIGRDRRRKCREHETGGALEALGKEAWREGSEGRDRVGVLCREVRWGHRVSLEEVRSDYRRSYGVEKLIGRVDV